MKRQFRGQRGLTLIELLVVLLILGMIAGLMGPRIMKYQGSSKIQTAKIQLELFANSLDTYKLEIGRYPNTQEGLQALVKAPAGVSNWNGPYLKGNEVPKDPWGNEYQYLAPGKKGPYDVVSLGADGKEGGEGEDADLRNN